MGLFHLLWIVLLPWSILCRLQSIFIVICEKLNHCLLAWRWRRILNSSRPCCWILTVSQRLRKPRGDEWDDQKMQKMSINIWQLSFWYPVTTGFLKPHWSSESPFHCLLLTGSFCAYLLLILWHANKWQDKKQTLLFFHTTFSFSYICFSHFL